MKVSRYFVLFAIVFVFGMISRSAAAQSLPNLTAVGNGEKVRLRFGGKSKIITLEGTDIGDFTPGGDPAHRYTNLFSAQRGDSLYLVAKFQSAPAITNPNAPCGGDHPTTLLLIKTDKNLKLENVQTEIFASCAYNGAGRYAVGKPLITKNKVSISFDEGAKKYTLVFDADDAKKGLQLINR